MKWTAYIFDNPLLGADNIAIFENVLCKVDLWDRLFILDLLYRPCEVRARHDP
jgi:hypothetical protein